MYIPQYIIHVAHDVCVYNMFMHVAPPMRMGACSMECVLRQQIEY